VFTNTPTPVYTNTPTPTSTPTSVDEGHHYIKFRAAASTYLSSVATTTNYNDYQAMAFRSDNALVPLVQFDVSDIPTDAAITEAYLDFYHAGYAGTVNTTIGVHQVLTDTVLSQATWTIAKTGTNWTGAGCTTAGTDYTATATGTGTVGQSTLYDKVTVNVTSMVASWVATPTTNYGLLIRNGGEDNDTLTFFGTQNMDAFEGADNYAPALRVYYTDTRPTSTPTPTATLTPTPNISVVFTGPTPSNDPDTLAYVLTYTNNDVNPFSGWVLLDHDDSTEYVISNPLVSKDNVTWIEWWWQALISAVAKTFNITLDGPPASGSYTQSAFLISDDWDWYAVATHTIKLTVTAATATSTPTWTPTPTAANTPTRTPTFTATATYTPYATPASSVVINEICPVPDEDWNHDGAATEKDEYIELAEAQGASADITGWVIEVDDLDNWERTFYEIPETTQLDDTGHLVIFGYQYLREDTKLRRRIEFNLPNGNVCIHLRDGDGTEKDALCYYAGSGTMMERMVNLNSGDVYGRYPNAHSAYWQLIPGSPGWANAVATPTATPTHTPTATATP